MNVRDGKKTTALMWVTQQGYYEIANLLIKAKADVNLQNSIGYSVLIYAAAKGHFDILQLLLRVDGIDVNLTNNNGT